MHTPGPYRARPSTDARSLPQSATYADGTDAIVSTHRDFAAGVLSPAFQPGMSSHTVIVGTRNMSNDKKPYPRETPMPGWPELQIQLDALRANVEQMLGETSDTAQVYGVFAAMAGAIVARAPPDLVESVNSELGAILRDLKLSGDAVD